MMNPIDVTYKAIETDDYKDFLFRMVDHGTPSFGCGTDVAAPKQ